ncbi:ImmA/IrrE family metallo-endopeptidase [Rhodobacter capsulatus]|uniref:ImmA/IrrE family metallo-endopeptidase n=1 Tax=Rhodobacter capsulatus TaxID=1061 RepID=UPI0040262D23
MKSRINRPLPPNRVSRLPPINTSALDTPERVVDYCKSKGLISDDGAVDIERLIAEDANLKLIREDLGDKDASIEHIGDKFIIKVNSRHPKTRQRFSMAHEYAHYQLHRHMIKEMPVGEKIMFRDGASMPVEWQANRFAASVLMPFSAVNVALKRSNDDRILAARLLQVSLQALDYRIEQMGRS